MIHHLRRRRRDKFSGVVGYPNTTQAFTPSINRKTRRLNTGLDDKNQKFFEKELGMKTGDLSPQLRPDGSLISEFWQRYKLEVPPRGLDLNDENLSDALAIYALKVSSLVVTTKGAPTHKALWELYSDTSEAKGKNEFILHKQKAYGILQRMSLNEMSDYLISTGKDISSVDGEIIRSLVGTDVETQAEKFVARMENPLFKDRIWVYQLIQNNVVKEIRKAVFYNDIQLGLSIDDAIHFINKKEEKNQQLKLSLIRELEIATGVVQQEQEKKEVVVEQEKEIDSNESPKEERETSSEEKSLEMQGQQGE